MWGVYNLLRWCVSTVCSVEDLSLFIYKTKLIITYINYTNITNYSFCLCSVTPSQKYGQRGGKGEVVTTFGAVQGTRWVGKRAPGTSVPLELLEGSEETLQCSYKYMFQRLRDVRNGMWWRFFHGDLLYNSDDTLNYFTPKWFKNRSND